MTFLEAALEILKREGKALHYKDLTEKAMAKKLLTFVGRTPEVTMQSQLTTSVKKTPGNPFVRVKPGVFGLLRYPEMPRGAAAAADDDDESAESAETKDEAETKRRPKAEATAEGEAGARRRRRRRGGRGRSRADRPSAGAEASADAEAGGDEAAEPSGGLSAEAAARALAETGVLEGGNDAEDGDEEGQDPTPRGHAAPARDAEAPGSPSVQAAGADDESGEDDDGDEEAEEGGEAFAGAATGAGGVGDDAVGARRRRRRRRRRRGGGFEGDAELVAGEASDAPLAPPPAGGEVVTNNGTTAAAAPPSEGGAESGPVGESSAGRRIMTPLDAAIEILKGQPPGRALHVRQIADAAVRRRLVHGEPNEAWRVIRAALASEPKDRLRSGVRPRVRAAGSGLFALARRPPDMDLERSEHVFGEARRALRERTVAGLERRISEVPASAFEALARVLLQREGFGPATFVKRVEGTIYVEALRGRGSRPSKCLIALRSGGSPAGRKAIGELRAGVRARNQDEGVILLAGRLAEDAIAEWKQAGPPIEIADGPALAETCIRHGIGVINAMVSVDFVDADFFAELAEG